MPIRLKNQQKNLEKKALLFLSALLWLNHNKFHWKVSSLVQLDQMNRLWLRRILLCVPTVIVSTAVKKNRAKNFKEFIEAKK